MLGDTISKQLNDKYTISATNIVHIQNSIVIINKNLINNKQALTILKRNNNILLSDFIDCIVNPQNITYCDGLICCSHKALEYFRQNFPDTPTYFVQHGIDQRIGIINPSVDYFSPYYFGSIENILLFDSVKSILNIVYTDSKCLLDNNWHTHLHKSNFHYAVRPPKDKGMYKPFLKGFTAAACNSNILVHADDGDALYYLGEDYPYLIKEELCEEVVLRYMRQAKAEFGTEKWRYGLEKMGKLRELCSEQTMVRQFWDMIQHVTACKEHIS